MMQATHVLSPQTTTSATTVRRLPLLVSLCSLVGLTAISIDTTLPSMPSMAASLHVSASSIQTTLAAFVGCYALGQLAFGPISDRYGRKMPLLVALALYISASLLCALAPTVEVLTLGRALQGLGTCATAVAFIAISRDCFSGKTLARVLAITGGIASACTVAAPLLGAYLQRSLGWRSSFFFLALYGLGLFAWVALTLTETQAPQRPGPLQSPVAALSKLLTQPDFVRYSSVGAIAFCGLFAFLSTSSTLLITQRGISPGAFSLWFAANSLVHALACVYAARLLKRFSVPALISVGSGIVICGGLVMMMLWAQDEAWMFMVPMFVVMIGLALVLPASQAAAMEPFTQGTGLAAGVLGLLRFALAAAIALALSTAQTVIPVAFTLVVSGAICLSLTWNRKNRKTTISPAKAWWVGLSKQKCR